MPLPKRSIALLLTLIPLPAFAQPAPTTQPALVIDPAPAVAPFEPKLIPQAISGGYAIVVSKTTLADAKWTKVIDTLSQKYGSAVQVITWDKSVDDARPALAKMLPHYTCFVTRPSEASREFVTQVHRLTRNLNDDPYPDTIWGILTGLTADDADRIARTSTPLQIHNVVSTTGVHDDFYDSVFTVSDGKPGMVDRKGDPAKAVTVPDGDDSDRARSVVDAIHTTSPDFLVTSAHAGERVMEMPWSHGVLLGRHGDVIALSTSGKHGQLHLDNHGYQLMSPNPKVWLAAGNCLIGHISDANSMALAMMHSGGVTQMVGYTVTTWYGAAGWGTLGWFQGNPGQYSLAESFFINDAALTRRLATEFPGRERYAVKVYNDGDLGSLAQELGEPFPKDQKKAEDLIGLTWDHDVVAFYGDPAWDSRIAAHAGDYTQDFQQTKTGYTLSVQAEHAGDIKAFAFLPHRIHAADFQTSAAKDVLLTDSYVLVDFGKLTAGEKKQITISSTPAHIAKAG